ncbi:MAG: hypothetical protein OXN84_09010 [Albidovulum sp.]|nr:hypothetical protein [Albidovulum sp.]
MQFFQVRGPRGERVPYLLGIGADLYHSGVAAAKQVPAKHSDSRLGAVPNHAPAHVGLEARAKGFTDTLGFAGSSDELIAMGFDVAQFAATCSNYHLPNSRNYAVFGMNAAGIRFEKAPDAARHEGKAGNGLELETLDL